MEVRTTRFSGAEWADQLRHILMVGAGGINSWTALNLSRIGHDITLIDPDHVDQTNVHGGQMFRIRDIDVPKTHAVLSICREFGCLNVIDTAHSLYDDEHMNGQHIVVCGLDNMATRRQVFEDWREINGKPGCEPGRKEAILIDGRLTMEMLEIFAVRFDCPQDMALYEKNHLFSDDEAEILDCTTKQSTFSAMTIAGMITALLCNHLTNVKLSDDFRDVPFYQRFYFPLFDLKRVEAAQEENYPPEEIATPEEEINDIPVKSEMLCLENS